MSLFRKFTGIKFLIIILFSVTAEAQDSAITKIVIPGEEYEAGSIHRFFFGDHWRDLWTTPVEVPVLNLDTFDGGIVPVEKGGGMQTKSLRFRNKQGKEYKFRSINKDPSKALPVELRETFAEDIVRDQISTANPMSSIIVPTILNSLDILQAEPFLCILPDSKKLGEYREEFGGLFGTMEYHPDEYDDKSLNFKGADKVAGTIKLIERLLKNNDEFVHPTEYLKARLADILMGDWDRHIDQWRWARFDKDGKKYWYPIPRDRDQAFTRFDGIFPSITAMSITQLEHFSDDYYDIEDITWSGRYTDRRFLNTLSKEEWDSVTTFVKTRVTDSVITQAVNKLPAEMFKKGGTELINNLKSRRDKLQEISDEFYFQVIKYADIHLSDNDEYAEIKRLNDKEVEVKVFDLDKKKNPKSEPFYYRIFTSDETEEIRLIFNGGDDKAVISGEVDESIKLLISGDQGKDTLIDNSKVNGYLCSVFPITDAEQKTIFIDSGDKTVFMKGSSTSVVKEKYYKDTNTIETPRDWGHDWRFSPWFNVNPDDGLFIGGGAILYEFGFRRRPYIYRMELTGGYATLADRYRVRYTGEFNSAARNLKYLIEVKLSQLEVLNFYGFGNESTFNSDLKEDDFYKVRQRQLYIKPSVEYSLNENSAFIIGTQFLSSDTDDGLFLFQLNPYGSKNINLLSFNTDYIYDSRDNKDFPQSGLFFTASGNIYPPLKKSQSVFYKINSEAVFYFPLPGLRLSSLALKAGGEKLWGNFPYFESAFLGGESTLRGYDLNRFAGEASVYSSAELRILIAQTYFIFPYYFGISALADAGRVFYDNENSKKIRNSYGGGIWMSFIRPEYLFALYYARSSEDSGIYFTIGFPF